ncbi:unnamed protein product [Ixodes persulcatus]
MEVAGLGFVYPTGNRLHPRWPSRAQLFLKGSYLKELEAQIREKKERMLKEKEEEVRPRLSRKVLREALPPDVYSQELQKQQIEEKKQRDEEQRLKDAAEEEKLEKRVEEQRLKMYQEYNEERKRGKGKDLQVNRRVKFVH